MEWIPDAIEKTGEAFGITGLFLILFAAIIAGGIWWSVKNGEPIRSKPVADVQPMVVCGVGEIEGILREITAQNRMALERQNDITQLMRDANDRLVRIEDRTRKLV